jgi:hypothetical protein
MVEADLGERLPQPLALLTDLDTQQIDHGQYEIKLLIASQISAQRPSDESTITATHTRGLARRSVSRGDGSHRRTLAKSAGLTTSDSFRGLGWCSPRAT